MTYLGAFRALEEGTQPRQALTRGETVNLKLLSVKSKTVLTNSP